MAPGAILLVCILLAAVPLPAQSGNFLQRAFADTRGEQPLLGPAAPGFNMLVASRELDVERTGEPNVVRLSVAGIPLRFEMRYERQAGIDLYRIRHVSGSELRGEHVRFDWRFPESFNESMTFDTGALQGQPSLTVNDFKPSLYIIMSEVNEIALVTRRLTCDWHFITGPLQARC